MSKIICSYCGFIYKRDYLDYCENCGVANYVQRKLPEDIKKYKKKELIPVRLSKEMQKKYSLPENTTVGEAFKGQGIKLT